MSATAFPHSLSVALRARGSVYRDTRGATMVEYALLLTLVLPAAAPMLRLVGARVKASFEAASTDFEP